MSAPPKSGIVWLASYPRSGNTWTRSFIHNLAKILAGENEEQDINGMTQFSVWDISKPFYTSILGFAPTEENHQQIAEVRHQVHQHIADSFEGLVFVKTHQAMVIDRSHPTINFAVTSAAAYMIRNPLDVVISMSHHFDCTLDKAIDIMGTAGYQTRVDEKAVYEIYGSWSEHVWSWTRTPHSAIHVMRYEDMLADPMGSLGNLAKHLRLDASPTQIGLAIERSTFKRLQAQEEKHGFLERPKQSARFFREGRAGQWKEVLTPAQVSRLVRDHGEQMARFGYTP
jgi:hypothetical protein